MRDQLLFFAALFCLAGLYVFLYVRETWRDIDALLFDLEEFPRACEEARRQAREEMRAASKPTVSDAAPPKIPLPRHGAPGGR